MDNSDNHSRSAPSHSCTVLVVRVFVSGNAPLHAVDVVVIVIVFNCLAAAGFLSRVRLLLAFFEEPLPFSGEKSEIQHEISMHKLQLQRLIAARNVSVKDIVSMCDAPQGTADVLEQNTACKVFARLWPSCDVN